MDILNELRELSTNMLWAWQPNTIAVFRDVEPTLWRETNHNPVAFLKQLSAERLQERAAELALDARVSYAFHRLHDYLERRDCWGDTYGGPLKANPVAYFSAEFGLHESMPIYSGGLGTLAGDHLKSASDLGIPIVGVGLLYAQGYFNQRLDANGWQQESYYETNVEDLPLSRVEDPNGSPLLVYVDTLSARIALQVWRVGVGRSTLLLLDSDVDANPKEYRQVTGRLYGGDDRLRITQELIMGVGGVRALRAVGIRPAVLHLNEGHSAFGVLEVARQEIESDGVSFEEAAWRARARTVFTTHTPVEAGHDRFDKALVEETLGPISEKLGLSPDDLMALGRVDPSDSNEKFCMTVLGLKMSWKATAVSSLHGRVTRRMWRKLWPGRPEQEVPIVHVTNGVHVASWLAPSMQQLYDRYLGPDWGAHMTQPGLWSAIEEVEDGELWEAHQIAKVRLVSYVQREVHTQEGHRGNGTTLGDMVAKRMEAKTLTIGFARRFPTYKRGDLLLTDAKRLERLISHPKYPIQVVFAGKAHPKDEPGKRLIQKIYQMSRDPRFAGRLIFIEDYDINVARHLVQGVDLWLNLPRRPLEACGTSGMKAVFNGVINCSVIDGWWAEAYDGQNGFAVGAGGEHADSATQDHRDAESLYSLLETDVIPLYYDRDKDGVPQGWVRKVKNAIRSLAWRFNADRMVMEYAKVCYLPLVGVGLDGTGVRSPDGAA